MVKYWHEILQENMLYRQDGQGINFVTTFLSGIVIWGCIGFGSYHISCIIAYHISHIYIIIYHIIHIVYHIISYNIPYHIKFHSPCVSSWLWQGCHWPKQTCILDSSDGLSNIDAWWTARWRQMEWHQFLLLSAQHAGLGICDLKEHHMGHPSRSEMINFQMLYNPSQYN